MGGRIFVLAVTFTGGPIVTVTLAVEDPVMSGSYTVVEQNIPDAVLTAAAGGGTWGNPEVLAVTHATGFAPVGPLPA